MQPTKRRTDKDDKSPFTLSFRFSKDLVEKISSRWAEDGFANRTALVEAACNLYFNTFECPRCKNRNHINSLYCSICGKTFMPACELKEGLELQYKEFQSQQETVLYAEHEVEEERERCENLINSSNLDDEVKSSLEGLLSAVPEDYFLGLAVQILDEGGVEAVCQAIRPTDIRQYAYNLNEVREFFKSPTYLKDNPKLTKDKADEIEDLIGDLIDYQINYEIMLKKSMYLCMKIINHIDKIK